MLRRSRFPSFPIAFAAAAALLAAVIVSSPARAAGLLIADGGFGGVLEIKEHDVKVTINNGIAVTEVEQVFVNTENRQLEALYTFPVPKGASVANFSMWIGGTEMIGEVVEKERARQIYESYKRTRVDPGLLEQVDYKTFEMRIFPIGPRAEQKVRISYYQELDTDHDWTTYVYPLSTATRKDIDQRVSGKHAFSLDARSAVPIAEMRSPSHPDGIIAARHAEGYWQASLESRGGDLARDIVLAYRTSRPVTGLDLIASRQEGEDGFFLLTLTAGEELAERVSGGDYVFILDVSGSMETDGKLILSRNSLGAFIGSLEEEDRFEVITFNIQSQALFGQLTAAAQPSRQRAQEFLDSQRARGGTILEPAINAAYRYADPDRPLSVVILSDGLTEQRERQALVQLIRGRPANARVFCVGVGNEVNRPLLEQLAQESGGLAAFISRGDDFERQAKAFRRKLLHPVARNLKVAFDGPRVYDVEPASLPDLFHGMPIRILGRYQKGGPVKVTLSGEVGGRAISNTAELELPRIDSDNPEIERMWAWRRVDRLLKEAEAAGSRQGAVEEIVRLGEAFSIVTEHTSFIVLENDAEYQRWKIDRRNALRIRRDRASQQRVREELARLRNKAADSLVPLASAAPAAAPGRPGEARPGASPNPAPAQQAPQPQEERRDRRRWDFNIPSGGGAIDPFSAAIAAGLAGLAAAALRRRSRK